ncbi:MAG: hypothetical protein NUV35_08380, partial [Syntrophomonadaceae bacterium]|nr:hypothetical protein [Syntrophomonadaceae bacterium]
MYQIYYYRVYETGGEINLDQLERDLGRAHDISRSRFARLAPKSIRMEQPPLQLTVGTALAGNGGPELQLTVRAKIFDIGAISLCLAAERHDDRLLDIAVSSAEDGWLEEQFAQGLALVRGILEPCLGDLQVDIDFYEDFTVYVVDSPALVQDPVAVLMGEHGPFSQQVREQVLRNTLSYTLDDYAILSWDSALLCDREPPVDLIELIEFANVQLLELRYYDR